jgi:Bacteriophage tail sheath protein
MPVTPTYPGVYIEEIPSGVRTITGVATSIAAFVGWAPRGPSDRAQRVLSWQDFERSFGGLHTQSLLGYAVYHFFANGGTDAYVIRLTDGGAGVATIAQGDVTVNAANPGEWANDYGVVTRRRTDDPTRFRLSIVLVPATGPEVVVESFENLSMNPTDPRFAGTVVNAESALVRVAVTGTNVPADTGTPSPRLAGGTTGAVLAPDTPAFHTALLPPAGTGGVRLLDHVDLFNLLCVPGETDPTTLQTLQDYCREERAVLIADCASNASFASLQGGPAPALTGDDAINAAFYFPWLEAPDPLQEGRPREVPPCGFVAGVYARTDATRGVFKAPAGTDASLTGVLRTRVSLTDRENGVLNVRAINCIRSFNIYGTVIWGARTLRGNDEIGSEWKYVPVRRTALFIEESLFRALKWVVFEPNDEPLWAQIRLNVGAFMNDLFRQGAFQGKTPQEAYFVKCDKETTTQSDINRGIVNIVVGFAPLKPAEFVIIKIQQMAGQIAT